MLVAEILEVCMLLSFGAAWPASIYKSYVSKTAKGKSLVFMLVIFFGYIFGLSAKFIGDNINFVILFYLLNLFMVAVDILLYMRNKRFDMQEE